MRRALPYVTGALVLAACSDTLPVEQPRSAVPRLSAAHESSNRYVVLLGRSTSADEFTRDAESLGGRVIAVHEGAGFAVVEGLSSSAANLLAKRRGVKAVEPDLEAQLIQPSVGMVDDVPTDALDVGAASQSNPATASIFVRQWNQRAIGSPVAWTAGRLGSPAVTVAILDSGIDDSYPDLTGLVDASRSASFLPATSTDCLNPSDHQLINGRAATPTCPALPAFFPGKPPWADLNGHGTLTGGIVSSKAVVAAGVTSRVTLMAVKVLGARGSGSFSAILQGVAYATDQGADVINMSLGVLFVRHGGFIGFLNGITQYARSRGVTVVVAAGNDAVDLDHSGGVYAAFCSSGQVICVSATGPVIALNNLGNPSVNGPNFLPTVDEPAIYSNFGSSSIEVAAPGGNFAVNTAGQVTSAVAVWGGCSRTSLDFIEPDPPAGSPPGTPPPPPFYRKSVCADPAAFGLSPNALFVSGGVGTSGASPHVAGLAALLVETLGRNPGQIRTHLQETAVDLGKPGVDPRYGKGRISVPRALGL
jgi:subtilisin family serine protease